MRCMKGAGDMSVETVEIEGEVFPALKAEWNTPRQWRAWCPHCRRYHFHGAGPGHRAAHCADGPFKGSGYVLLAPDAPSCPTSEAASTP